MKNLELFICFLLFFILMITTIYYPIIAIEYFSTIESTSIENVVQVHKSLCCKSYEKKNLKQKIDDFVEILDNQNDNNNKYSYSDLIVNDEKNELDEQYSPSCCPSIVTSSTGCLCTNSNLISMIQSRGNNKEMCV